MVFTNEEEEILKLMINELRTRKKLELKMKDRDDEFKTNLIPIQTQINDSHRGELDILEAEFEQSKKEIEDKFN